MYWASATRFNEGVRNNTEHDLLKRHRVERDSEQDASRRAGDGGGGCDAAVTKVEFITSNREWNAIPLGGGRDVNKIGLTIIYMCAGAHYAMLRETEISPHKKQVYIFSLFGEFGVVGGLIRCAEKTRRNTYIYCFRFHAHFSWSHFFRQLLLLLLHNIYGIHRSIQFGEHTRRSVSQATGRHRRLQKREHAFCWRNNINRGPVWISTSGTRTQQTEYPIAENGPINSYLL